MLEMLFELSGLVYNGYKDMRTKEISLVATLCYGVAGILRHFALGTMSSELLLCMVPGLICFVLAALTREGIGYGDAWVLLAMGCVFSFAEMRMICYLAVGGAAVFGLILCTLFHKRKEYAMPFVPFLFAAALMVLLEERYGWIS